MERIKQIMKHPLYQSNQQTIEALEQDRIFCRHDIGHALDVARILYILVLEKQLTFSKDVIYATALLHDIGRAVEYEESKSHHEVGPEIAKVVLKDCGYNEAEIMQITGAIASHQNCQSMSDSEEEQIFRDLFYTADKLSRNCFSCEAKEKCYWEDSKKNHFIVY